MPSAQASFGVTEPNFEAGTCLVNSCTYATGPFYTQAAGHPPWGITSFELNHTGSGTGKVPEGALRRIRVDVPPGLAANPQALPQCKRSDFDANACPAETQVGTTELVVYDGITDIPVEGKVFNLEQPPGLPLDFGIDVGVEPLVNTHLFLEGHVDWSGDYHEYFEINEVPKSGSLLGVPVPLETVKSKLNFNGTAGKGNFLTLPSVCSSSTTSYLEVESYEGAISRTPTHTPVGVEHCEKVPFKPTAAVTPETAQSDQPDGATTVLKVPQNAEGINTADIKDVHLTLPEGMTLNPSAAHGLETCTPAQIGIGTANRVECPKGSQVGTVTIETDLPPNSLTGGVYLGNPSGGPITGPPYTIYLDAESVYGVSVRLKGSVNTNPASGRLEASFVENPQLPFSELLLSLRGGPRAPLANPLACGSGLVESLFTAYTGAGAQSSTPFITNGCPAPLPFSLAQSTQHSSPNAGTYTAYTFNLGRADGQQYLSQVSTVLPPGLLGAIPSVTLCGEPAAQAGSCPTSSQIGTAAVAAGAGGEPYGFSGPVYLTGPYNGAPYGLSIPIEAAAGPFDLGRVVTRAAINVDPHSARVIVTSALPTIVKGVPLRLRNVSVSVNRPNFLFNPSSCSPLATDSTLTSTFKAVQAISSPFAVGNCAALAFKPAFSAASNAKASRAGGASLKVTLVQGVHQANMRSVVAQLPIQLPARFSTLQKACPEATYAANPRSCPVTSLVGSANVVTPVLPGALSGPAYLVSHGGAGFPDLDLLLEGDGVRVILVGNTNIKNGITTSTFASIPDVPVSSFVLTLPMSPHSALASFGNLCSRALIMPTTITAQSGAQIKQNTRIAVENCGVRIVRRRMVRHTLLITLQTFAAGRVSVSARNLRTASKRVSRPSTFTLRVALSRAGQRALRRHRRMTLAVHVAFAPRAHGEPRVAVSTSVTVRR